MKKYMKAVVGTFAGESDKAFALTNGHGAWGRQNATHDWFPKSQCIIGEANEYGWREILVPYWLMKQKGLYNLEVYDEIHHQIGIVEK